MKLENITVRYADKLVLDRFSLDIGSGVTCLSGPSGCGKTTLLRVAAGLLIPDEGTVTGRPSRISFMFQEDRLFPWLTALENIELVCRDRDKALRCLEAVELGSEAGSLPSSLSGGMKRRVALARALAFECGLLLLDEPFKGMDPDLTRRLIPLITSLDVPVIAATHSEEELALLGGRVVEMETVK
ncbi:MAG: ABC transporter ATP-binding protein [Firmicutes bacterium]|nr:ABC transporter ATP-binding protein [Bacillota bacterium]MBR0521792.1 ABC transporter ATP-binding protein [Bacillota bacterium]